MNLYTIKDVELIERKIDDITDRIEKHKLDIFEPTKKEIMAANKIVMDFVKEHKRKIYGGYAQNKVIVSKNPKDAFYDDDDIPDIDVYSPEPLKDLVEICDIFQKMGFKGITGQEAMHKETYKIFVNGAPVLDLSYVPKNIYNRIPYIEIDGINYVHPSFVYIDMFRMLTDPYFSGSHRWKKIMPRLYKLQKYYPFNKVTKELNDAYDVPKDKKEIVNNINKFIFDMIKNKENYIITGQYAYNYLLEESGIMNDKVLGKKYKMISTPFMQIISTNYIPDIVNIILELRKLFNNDKKLTYKEYYPLWMFTGYSTVIYYDGIPVLHITAHNNRCVPIRKVEARFYNNNKVVIDAKSTVQLGCFDFIFLMNLISGLRVRVNSVENKCHYHNVTTSHLIEIRQYYLHKTKKTLLDESLFKSFIPDCVGETMDPQRESRLIKNKKYKEGKLVIFRYDPLKPRDAPDYKFANTSGNEIFKDRNYKIQKYIDNPKLLEDFIKKSYDEKMEETEIGSEGDEN